MVVVVVVVVVLRPAVWGTFTAFTACSVGDDGTSPDRLGCRLVVIVETRRVARKDTTDDDDDELAVASVLTKWGQRRLARCEGRSSTKSVGGMGCMVPVPSVSV